MATEGQVLPFRMRVENLRDIWGDLRLAYGIRTVADWESQRSTLALLHRWASTAVEEATAVYGGEIPIEMSPPPGESAPSFSVRVRAGQLLIRAAPAAEDHRLWRLKLSLKMAEGPTPVAVKPNRSPPHWTRAVIEEMVLALLSSYERTRSGSLIGRRREGE